MKKEPVVGASDAGGAKRKPPAVTILLRLISDTPSDVFAD